MKAALSAPDPVDRRFMAMALALARARIGRVGARPAVGAVIATDRRVLGRGATGSDGRPHAEPLAVEQARIRYGADSMQGATAYVTLEPCAHHGRTPPCAEALIGAGIARVVAPFEDPDPRVSGRGFTALRSAGVEVSMGLMADDARRVNRGFLTRMATGRPWVTLKLAATLDGRIATRLGESRWITGETARRRVHLMRARADAVLVGAGTARADDPMLDVRGFGPGAARPLRVVADGGLTLPLESRLAASASDQPVALLHRADAPGAARQTLGELGMCLIEVPTGSDGQLDLKAGLQALGLRGINTVLAEGGGTIAASMLSAGLVDDVALFTAGRLIGGDGVPAVAGFGIDTLEQAPELSLVSVEALGADTLSLWERPSGLPGG